MLVGSWGHVGGWIFPLYAPENHDNDGDVDVGDDRDGDGNDLNHGHGHGLGHGHGHGHGHGEDILEEEEAVDEDGKHDGVEATGDQVHSSNVPVKGLKYFFEVTLLLIFVHPHPKHGNTEYQGVRSMVWSSSSL